MTNTIDQPVLAMEIVTEGSQATICLAGEVDVAVAADLAALGALTASSEAVEAIVLDMSSVSFIDCAGIGALIAIRLAARERFVDVRLRGITPAVDRVLGLTGLKPVFATTADTTERC